MGRTIDARVTRFGGFLEDFEEGDSFLHWPGITITEAEAHQFCLLTLAASPVHLDAHYAASEMECGKNIVIGTYIYALLLGMSVPDISGKAIANLGCEMLRHVAPVFYGDTLYGETTVVSLRPSQSRPRQGILTVDTVGKNQDGNVVCTFRRSVLLPRRPQPRVEEDAGPAVAPEQSEKSAP